MKRRRSRAIIIGFFIFAPSLILPKLFGCSYFTPNYRVGRNFTVKVSSQDGTSFRGVKLLLRAAKDVANSSVTNDAGEAFFEGIEPGEYSLEVGQLGSAGWDTATLTVAEGLESPTIALHWPSSRILRATRLKGVFIDTRTATPLSNTSLDLLGGIDSAVKARVETAQEGRFDFTGTEPGLYFIKISPHHPGNWEPEGFVPILIGRDGNSELFVAVGESSCGLLSSELCTAEAHTVKRVRGRVGDPERAAISRARVELWRAPNDDHPTAVAEADRSGRFDFKKIAPGDYQMKISSSGFVPTIFAVTVAARTSVNNFINVRLALLGGSCKDLKGRTVDMN